MATPHHLPKKRKSPKSTQRSLFFKRHFCGLSQSDVSTSPFVEESDSASQASEDEETHLRDMGLFWRQVLKILTCSEIFGVLVLLASYLTIGSFRFRTRSNLSIMHGKSEVWLLFWVETHSFI